MAKRKTIEVPTPECDKMLAVKEKSQAIGEFLDWMQESTEYAIGEYDDRGETMYPAHINIEKLLADYFDIDLNKVEAERRAILDAIQQVES